ncbi:hypothetical protein J6590_048840 [Homalodisca vitripennis]|nr:hypothetical protein J6590_048840 [Homalodisca vitripennis]
MTSVAPALGSPCPYSDHLQPLNHGPWQIRTSGLSDQIRHAQVRVSTTLRGSQASSLVRLRTSRKRIKNSAAGECHQNHTGVTELVRDMKIYPGGARNSAAGEWQHTHTGVTELVRDMKIYPGGGYSQRRWRVAADPHRSHRASTPYEDIPRRGLFPSNYTMADVGVWLLQPEIAPLESVSRTTQGRRRCVAAAARNSAAGECQQNNTGVTDLVRHMKIYPGGGYSQRRWRVSAEPHRSQRASTRYEDIPRRRLFPSNYTIVDVGVWLLQPEIANHRGSTRYEDIPRRGLSPSNYTMADVGVWPRQPEIASLESVRRSTTADLR